MLIERFGDTPEAVDQFIKLVDEHGNRIPRLVATISGVEGNYAVRSRGGISTFPNPSSFDLIAYNNEDPGLFARTEDPDWLNVRCDKAEFYMPSLHRFQGYFGGHPLYATVLDESSYERWAASSIGAEWPTEAAPPPIRRTTRIEPTE